MRGIIEVMKSEEIILRDGDGKMIDLLINFQL